MERMVLLRHTLPDGSTHLDWMLQRPEADENPGLVTFRLDERLDRLDGASGPHHLRAERIADHRPRYLEFEGQIRPELGHVKRLAAGEARIGRDGETGFETWIRFADQPPMRVTGEPEGAGWWRLTVAPAHGG